MTAWFGHKDMFELNREMSDISRPTGGPVGRLTRVTSCCIDKLTSSWRFKLDKLPLKPRLLVGGDRVSDESRHKCMSSGEARFYVLNL